MIHVSAQKRGQLICRRAEILERYRRDQPIEQIAAEVSGLYGAWPPLTEADVVQIVLDAWAQRGKVAL